MVILPPIFKPNAQLTYGLPVAEVVSLPDLSCKLVYRCAILLQLLREALADALHLLRWGASDLPRINALRDVVVVALKYDDQ